MNEITQKCENCDEKQKEIDRLTHLHNLDHSLADQWQKKNVEQDATITTLREALGGLITEYDRAMITIYNDEMKIRPESYKKAKSLLGI